MAVVYEYNSATINFYSEEDCGLITTSSLGMDDYGDLSSETEISDDNYFIDCNETLTPFGSIKIESEEVSYSKESDYIRRIKQVIDNSILLTGIIFRWVGFSVVFQLSSDLQRNLIPDVSGGGKS